MFLSFNPSTKIENCKLTNTYGQLLYLMVIFNSSVHDELVINSIDSIPKRHKILELIYTIMIWG